MRIDTKEIPGLRDLTLDSSDAVRFASSLPSQSLIEQSWGNPDFGDVLAAADLGRQLTANAASATRWVQGIAGTNIGVPGAIIQDFRKAVHKWGPAKWDQYATGAVMSTMDIGLDAMGSVPVIGWASQIAAVLVKVLIERSKQKKPAPPNLKYDKEADEFKADQALRAFYSDDLRRVFMPPATDVTAWRVEPATPGFTVKWDGEPAGLGVIPGASIVAGALFSHIHWTSERYMACSPSGRSCSGVDGELNKSQRASVRRDWGRVFEGTIMPLGDITPSLRRVGASLWSMLSSTKSANAFELDTRGLAGAWQQWYVRASRAADDAQTGGVKMYIDRYVGFQALHKSLRLDFYGVEGGTKTVSLEATERVLEIQKLQSELLDTLAVAYASEEQPAFRDPELKDKLRTRRGQLLRHMARWKVSAADIVDADFRAEFEAATAGDRPLRAPTSSDSFGREPRRVSPLAGPSVTGGGASVLLLALGGLMLARG